MTIRTPNGNEVTEVVLPDGTTASEVIDPDGNVVFSAVPDVYNPLDEAGASISDAFTCIGCDNDGVGYFGEVRLEPTFSGTVVDVEINLEDSFGSAYDVNVDVYLAQEGLNGSATDGTLITSGWDPAWASGVQSIPINTEYTVQQGTTYTLGLETTNTVNDGDFHRLDLRFGGSPSTSWYQLRGGAAQYYADVSVYIQ